MNAAILCPGPSLARTFTGNEPAYSLLAGINRSATKFSCNIWCSLDWISEGSGRAPGGIKNWAKDVIGTPLLLTNADAVATLERKGIPWRGPTVTTDSIRDSFPGFKGWTLYSFTSAIMFAAHLGATSIDCYGCDWTGDRDFDGVNAGGNRTEDRWKTERELFSRICEYLKGKCDVKRII